jgi:hypothetical protein
MKKIHYFVVILIAVHFSACTQKRNELTDNSVKTVTISFTGDLMCHTPEMDYANAGKDSFDFKPMFGEVKKYLSKSNLVIGNLETTISGKESQYSGYPLFNAPDSFLEGIKYAGFNFLLTSNNHAYDRAEKGILRTLEKVRALGFKSAGSYSSQQERNSISVFQINGINFAMLSYTYGLNGHSLPKGKKYLVNIIDTTLISQDIKTARDKNAEVVLVYFHFGNEYQSNPSVFQKEIVKRTISYGADFIIGSHPHVIQPAEFFSSDKNRVGKGIVAYSLGNLVSNQRWRYSDCGVILNFSVKKDFKTNSVWLADVSYMPTWVFKGRVDKTNRYIIVPDDSTSLINMNNYLSKSDRDKMKQSFDDTNRLLKPLKEFKPAK